MNAASGMIGRVFGRLTVIRREDRGYRRPHWVCWCECGATTVARTDALTTGNTKSCGCLVKETMARTGRSNEKHGESRSNDGGPSPTFISWQRMIQRCHYEKAPNFSRYGGAGIAVCERWRVSFEAFLADMGGRPAGTTLDRIDGRRGYEPGNCRWATPLEQASNRKSNRKAI